MNKIEEFYSELASMAIRWLFDEESSQEDLKYLDPLEFESYVKGLSSQLWPGEFRRAADFINDYKARYSDDTTTSRETFTPLESLEMAAHGLCYLAGELCPTMIPELKQRAGIRPPMIQGLPPELNTEEVRTLFEALKESGYLDDKFQPKSAAKNVTKAYIAHTIAALAFGDIPTSWRPFEMFWGTKNLKQSYSQKSAAGVFHDTKIDRALYNAIKNSATLAATKEGKRILEKYSK